MLAQLRADHLGPNRGYYLDVPFAETLARHATKPIVNDAGEEALRDWYRERDVLPGGIETVIGADSQIVSRSQLRACCHHRATTECASAKHPLRLRSGPHRPPRRPGRNADAGCVPGDRQGPALLPPGRGDLRGEHLAAGQPLASPGDIEDLDGWTLHRLRHSALTHDAEGGTSTRCCWPAPAASVRPWSGTPAPASTLSPGMSPNATPPPRVSPSTSGLQDHPVARLARISVTRRGR